MGSVSNGRSVLVAAAVVSSGLSMGVLVLLSSVVVGRACCVVLVSGWGNRLIAPGAPSSSRVDER